jgi:hypothetical protein
MSSSPEPEPTALRDEGGAATMALWRRRSRAAPAVPYAAALIGSDVATLRDATSLTLAASPEAARLLDGMELRVRTLPTGVDTEAERCVFSVRGPVMWSETITARANALGNEDVFVCSITRRSFDTVENRVLVAALEAIARAGRALRGPTGAKVPPQEAARIAEVAREAGAWRAHPRLADVQSRRLSGRDLARLRGGHRTSRLGTVLAIRERVAEPFVAEDLVGLADPWTWRYHAFVEQALVMLERSVRLPGSWTVSDGGLWSGPVSWRHPAADGGTPPGLCYRGIPLLPPQQVTDGAPWRELVPADGVRIMNGDDLERLGERMRQRSRPVGAGAGAQSSRSSSGSA